MSFAESTWIQISENLIVEELDDSVLLYASDTDVVHCLGAEASAVWRAAAGGATAAAIAATTELEAELVEGLLGELVERDLVRPAAGEHTLTRRQFAGRTLAAGVGAAMIWSMASPTASAAASAPFETTTTASTTAG